MTSMDSGVDMGNDSNDSFITQQEFCTAGAGTATTTTTTITTTLTAASNYENGTNTFLIQTTPFSLQSPISSVSAIQKDTDNGNSELLMPMYIGSKPSISPTANPIKYRICGTSRNGTTNFHLEDNFRLYHEKLLQSPYMQREKQLSSTVKFKYKEPGCYGKIKSIRNRNVAWSYAFNRNAAIHKKILLTKMVLATAANNTELMQKLLTNGMSPDFHDHEGQTALHIASSLGYTDMVQLLLLHGANPNQRDCVGNTPLHFASRRCRISIMTLLLKAGAEIVSRDKDGFNPLQLVQEHLRLCPERFKGANVDDMLKVKQEIHELINLITYLEKQKNSQEAVEALSKLYSSLSVSNTAD